MRTIHRLIVSALLFSADNRLLMGKKDPKSGGVYLDCWHIPGGGIDENENQIQALTREIQEEVGIDISIAKIELVDSQGKGESEKTLKETKELVTVKMNFYIYKVSLPVESNIVKVSLNDDLKEYKWFKLSEIESVKLTPPSISLFKRLGYL